jgi:hypothetical protein
MQNKYELYQILKARLIDEWFGKQGVQSIPDILEKKNSHGQTIHIQIIWDEWHDLDAITRSELIVDVFEIVKGQKALIELVLAVGLTRAEAIQQSLI